MTDNNWCIKKLRDSCLRHNHFISWRWDPLVCNYVYFSSLLLC